MIETNLINFDKVGNVLKEISLKIRDREQRYVWMPVKSLKLNIPIWETTQGDAELILADYIERQCHNDLKMAKSEERIWKAHVVSICVQSSDKLLWALAEGSYLNIYTENILITELYLQILSLNPHLKWSNLCWPKDPEVEKKKEISKQISKQILSSVSLLQGAWQKECLVGDTIVERSFSDLVKSLENFAKTL
jgi:hypothetical protein